MSMTCGFGAGGSGDRSGSSGRIHDIELLPGGILEAYIKISRSLWFWLTSISSHSGHGTPQKSGHVLIWGGQAHP